MATNDEAGESVIQVDGARIERIEETLRPWREALEGSAEFVTLDLSAVDAADVTLFQALLAFRRSLEDKGRHLLLSPLPNGHPVLETGRMLGIPLEYHFTLVGAGS